MELYNIRHKISFSVSKISFKCLMAPTNFINHNTTHICEAKYASKINLKTLLTF